jgi:hypothetical protein
MNIGNIHKTSNDASRGGRSRFQAHSAWMRPRSATLGAPIPRDSRAPARSHPRKRGPCSTLRCAADTGRNPEQRQYQVLMNSGAGASFGLCPRLFGEGGCSWGGDGGHGVARCRYSGALASFPQTGLRLTCPDAIVASPLLRMTKQRAFLRALSQNRASASRVSSC